MNYQVNDINKISEEQVITQVCCDTIHLQIGDHNLEKNVIWCTAGGKTEVEIWSTFVFLTFIHDMAHILINK